MREGGGGLKRGCRQGDGKGPGGEREPRPLIGSPPPPAVSTISDLGYGGGGGLAPSDQARESKGFSPTGPDAGVSAVRTLAVLWASECRKNLGEERLGIAQACWELLPESPRLAQVCQPPLSTARFGEIHHLPETKRVHRPLGRQLSPCLLPLQNCAQE